MCEKTIEMVKNGVLSTAENIVKPLKKSGELSRTFHSSIAAFSTWTSVTIETFVMATEIDS